MSKLQPCPFCGEDNSHVMFWELKNAVVCFQCIARGPESFNQKSAIRLWNKRAVQANPKAKPVEKMQEVAK